MPAALETLADEVADRKTFELRVTEAVVVGGASGRSGHPGEKQRWV